MSVKKIYREDELYAAVSQKGAWYLSYTTLDPDEKYKSKYVASISEKPDKEFILRKDTNPRNGAKKYFLDKEALAESLESSYGVLVVDEPSPWVPLKLGQKRAPVAEKRKSPASSDSDSDTDTPAPKRSKPDPMTRAEVDRMFSLLEASYAAILTVAAEKRQTATDSTDLTQTQ